MKKTILTFCLLNSIVLAGVFEDSFKIYSKDADNLYMAALSAVSTSKQFKIVEMQSKNGYILFLYGSKYYLLTITKRYQNQTEVKVMPQNSDFSQGSIVAQNIFALIDNEINSKPMEQIK